MMDTQKSNIRFFRSQAASVPYAVPLLHRCRADRLVIFERLP
jgi:hypothetical protein